MIALGAMLFALMLTFDLLHERLGLLRFRLFSLGVAASAALALVSGIALLIWTGQGAGFYLHNPVFYIKLAVFVAMLLIAITPARVIHQWHRDAMSSEAGTGALVDASLVPLVQRYVIFELMLLLVIPLAASLAGRGIGTQLSAS